MKKIITLVITAILPMFAMLSSLRAQESGTIAANNRMSVSTPPAKIGSTSSSSVSSNSKTAKELKKEAREFKQFSRVTRNFENSFKDATGVSWSKQKDGYSAMFDQDGLRNIVWYDLGGSITHQMITYNAQRAPSDVKRMVKHAYDGYEITCVNEIHQDDIVVYLVTVENDKNIKQVTLCNGEINKFKEYKKAL